MIDTAALAKDIEALAADTPGRFLLGVAGAPASGKSTLAADLAAAVDGAVVVPMDGFHLDDKILNARGDRPRKGAPYTFDVGGFCSLLERLKRDEFVYAPEFDRSIEASYGSKIEIGPEARIVITEGLYLLHDDHGWQHVAPLLDQCWYLDVPEDELRRRLEERWRFYELPDEQWTEKLDGNDMPNARLVASTRDRADRILRF